MPISKKVKARKMPSAAHTQRSKMLYLPMPRADVDALMLPSRIALEMALRGRANASAARRLASLVILTRLLTEAGHGQLDIDALRDAETTLAEVFATGNQSDRWSFPEGASEALRQIVNEHERQLCETRLEAIAKASARLDTLVERHGSALPIGIV
jgi:hypothetical protein